MNWPKISIVTPTLNQGDFIEETILSIVGQNYPNLEYIIIDGGSTDQTLDIIKKHQDKINHWVSEKDQGLYHAIQKGFDKSSGDIMAWLNSDDIYFKESLFLIAEIFKEFPETEWLTGNPTCIDERSRIVETFSAPRLSKADFYTGEIKLIQQESTFWRRSLWEKAGGKINHSLKLAGDYDLWLNFFQFASLHTIETSIGGFRYRKQNQKSLEQHELYIQEAKQQRNKVKFTKEEQDLVNKLEFYEKIILKLPLLPRLNSIQQKYSSARKQLLNAPSNLYFCRTDYKFKRREW